MIHDQIILNPSKYMITLKMSTAVLKQDDSFAQQIWRWRRLLDSRIGNQQYLSLGGFGRCADSIGAHGPHPEAQLLQQQAAGLGNEKG